MKRLLLFIAVTLLLLVNCASTFANHIFGGELLYTNISGNTYAITLTLYGDCAATTFGTLVTSTPTIKIYNGAALFDTLNLSLTGPGLNVSPVCPNDSDSTTCTGGTLPGVTRYIYSDTVTLSGTSANWHFIFEGNMNNSAEAGRSTQLTNINQANAVTIMYIEATLNNLQGPNSSPEYSTIPTPFYCINVQEQYNQGAVDPDNDSLVFNLTPALDANTGGSPVNYISPFTATNPLSTDSNSFVFNNLNGQMTFTANVAQDALVVSKVSEYRNGVVVGTSVREMAIIILPECQAGSISISDPANTVGAVNADSNSSVINVCVGTPEVSFNIAVADSTQDSIQLTTNSVPPGANVTIVNNGSSNIQLSFDWNTTNVAPGIYSFFVTYNDYHCPISSHQTIAYTINIVNPNTITSTMLYPTQCFHKAYIQYNLANGALPRPVVVSQGGNVIATYSDTSGVIRDSIATGDYTVTVGATNLACPTTYVFSVTDGGTLPKPDVVSSNFCQGDLTTPISILTINDNATITWYDSLGNSLPGQPSINTSVPGTYTSYFTEQYKVCKSNLDTVISIVYPKATVTIIDTSSSLCYGDIVPLKAVGGTSYIWTPQDQIIGDSDGYAYVRALQPITITAHTVDVHGCTDSASISLTDIQQCCQFSYPNAFSPNNDSHNDKFSIVTYGNVTYFSILVFDRWGNCVFRTNDPENAWDGTYKGKPCEEGTYFYIVHAQCMTGHAEDYKGDLILLR